jgi:hypothetical protein
VILVPGETWHCCLIYALADGDVTVPAPPHFTLSAEKPEHAEAMADWLESVVKIRIGNEEFYRLLVPMLRCLRQTACRSAIRRSAGSLRTVFAARAMGPGASPETTRVRYASAQVGSGGCPFMTMFDMTNTDYTAGRAAFVKMGDEASKKVEDVKKELGEKASELKQELGEKWNEIFGKKD